MSYVVAHVQKFKQVDVRGIEIHVNRESVNNKNKDINIARTKDNINLCADETRSLRQRVKDRLAENKNDKALRKDAVVLCSVVVSASADFFTGMTREQMDNYFQAATEYLQSQFGKNNIVGAHVHYDEGAPHMHYTFVPMTEDGRVCAKEIVTRKSLTRLQDELPKYLQSRGYNVERGVKDSPRYHIDTSNWKRDELVMEATKEKLLESINVETTNQKKFFKGETGNVIIAKEDFEQLQRMAAQSVHLIENKSEFMRRVDEIEKRKRDLENLGQELDEQRKKILSAAREQQKKSEELLAVQRKLDDQKLELDDYKKILEAQDKNVQLLKLINDNEHERKLIEEQKRKLDLEIIALHQEQERAVERVHEAAKRAVMKELDQVETTYWERKAMARLKEERPDVYEKLVIKERQRAYKESRERAGREYEKLEEHEQKK